MPLITSPPDVDPGEPDLRSATRFLAWLYRRQAGTLLIAGFFGTAWMASIAVLPGALGLAIDEALAPRDWGALWAWSGAIVAIAVAMAFLGMIRHRFAVHNFLTGAYRVVRLATRHTTRVGAELPRRISTGEAVSVGSADPTSIGMTLDVFGRTIGSVVTFIGVAIVLIDISVPLGLVILIGLPVQALAIGPLLKPLQRREHDYRTRQGELTSRANDIVSGLRVLRGIGGEELFARRYREDSADVRDFGVRVAATSAIMRSLQTLLPGILLIAVTWLGAHLAVANQISSGDLVAVFGYTAFLMMPMSVFLETARKLTTAHAAASRIVRLLSVKPAVVDAPDAARLDGPLEDLHDPASGVTIHAGRFTALACTDPEDAAIIADRLGRYTDSDATIGDQRLDGIALDDVRRRILVTDNDAPFFTGPLRTELDATGDHDDTAILAAVDVAAARDALDSAGGLDGIVEPAARNVSGGQRQRLRLARALLAETEALILIDPTSAVDAHTEALIAERLAAHRRDRTTVVASASPLMLERADSVLLIVDGKAVARGAHRELMATEPRYRALVTRETESEHA